MLTKEQFLSSKEPWDIPEQIDEYLAAQDRQELFLLASSLDFKSFGVLPHRPRLYMTSIIEAKIRNMMFTMDAPEAFLYIAVQLKILELCWDDTPIVLLFGKEANTLDKDYFVLQAGCNRKGAKKKSIQDIVVWIKEKEAKSPSEQPKDTIDRVSLKIVSELIARRVERTIKDNGFSTLYSDFSYTVGKADTEGCEIVTEDLMFDMFKTHTVLNYRKTIDRPAIGEASYKTKHAKDNSRIRFGFVTVNKPEHIQAMHDIFAKGWSLYGAKKLPEEVMIAVRPEKDGLFPWNRLTDPDSELFILDFIDRARKAYKC